jgi:hypothetical protein
VGLRNPRKASQDSWTLGRYLNLEHDTRITTEKRRLVISSSTSFSINYVTLCLQWPQNPLSSFSSVFALLFSHCLHQFLSSLPFPLSPHAAIYFNYMLVLQQYPRVFQSLAADPTISSSRIRVSASKVLTQSKQVLALRDTSCCSDGVGKHFASFE